MMALVPRQRCFLPAGQSARRTDAGRFEIACRNAAQADARGGVVEPVVDEEELFVRGIIVGQYPPAAFAEQEISRVQGIGDCRIAHVNIATTVAGDAGIAMHIDPGERIQAAQLIASVQRGFGHQVLARAQLAQHKIHRRLTLGHSANRRFVVHDRPGSGSATGHADRPMSTRVGGHLGLRLARIRVGSGRRHRGARMILAYRVGMKALQKRQRCRAGRLQ